MPAAEFLNQAVSAEARPFIDIANLAALTSHRFAPESLPPTHSLLVFRVRTVRVNRPPPQPLHRPEAVVLEP